MSVPTVPGLYWARFNSEPRSGKLEPVQLNADLETVDSIGQDMSYPALDYHWGPRLDPPAVAPVVPNDAHPLLHHLARSIEDIDAQIAKLAAKRTALAGGLVAKIAEWDRLQDQRVRALYDGHPNP